LLFLTIEIQYICNSLRSVFGSCMCVVLFHSIHFLTGKQVGYWHAVLRARRKTSNAVAVVPFSVHQHVTLHLGGPLRHDQLIVCSTISVLQGMPLKFYCEPHDPEELWSHIHSIGSNIISDLRRWTCIPYWTYYHSCGQNWSCFP
jgi:hypothetical protein